MCTIVGKVLDGRPQIASTSDNPYTTRTILQVKTPQNGYRYIGTVVQDEDESVAWSGMTTRGLNEKGLAFTYSNVPSNAVASSDTADSNEIKQFSEDLIGKCANVNEAADFLRRGVPAGLTGNYLLCDLTNQLILIEISNDHFKVESKNLLVRTNEFVLREQPPVPGESSIYGGVSSIVRRNQAELLLDKANSVKEIWSVLKDHHSKDDNNSEYGKSICNHGDKAGTISAELMVPSEKKFVYSYGRPCGTSTEKQSGWDYPFSFDLNDCQDVGDLTDIHGNLTFLGRECLKKW